MIERELISLLGGTCVMVCWVLLTLKLWHKTLDSSDDFQVLYVIIMVVWSVGVLIGVNNGVILWMDYLEAHGVLYTSGALK